MIYGFYREMETRNQSSISPEGWGNRVDDTIGFSVNTSFGLVGFNITVNGNHLKGRMGPKNRVREIPITCRESSRLQLLEALKRSTIPS